MGSGLGAFRGGDGGGEGTFTAPLLIINVSIALVYMLLCGSV